MPSLSVLIPARNEMFLNRTIESVLGAIKGNTEVIAVCDGSWPPDPIKLHPKLHVVFLPEPIGQRQATNLAARVSLADYIMKLDAHCDVEPGFDVKLMEAAAELGPDVTQIPRMYNLHAFDWVCGACGHRKYQGPTPTACEKCQSTAITREMVWQRRRSKLTEFWRFDNDLHFQYWGAYKDRPEAQGEIVDVMSSIGACWFMGRERFWQLGGLDEEHGSWGQMGTEIACKSWLSGGRQVVNRRTWFAHMFRTQGGDFSFPYPIRGSEQEKARAHSRDLWLNGTWPGAVHPLSWLIEKFSPIPTWPEKTVDEPPADLNRSHKDQNAPDDNRAADLLSFERHRKPDAKSKGLCYYSDCRGDARVLTAVRVQLLRIAQAGGYDLSPVTLGAFQTAAPPELTAALKPWPKLQVLVAERGYLTMFRQILMALEASTADVVFFTEHDVLYHPSHFEFTPPRRDRYYYNRNVWKVSAATGQALFYECDQTSGLCAYRELLLTHYRERVRRVEAEGFTRKMGFEPGTRKIRHGGIDDVGHEAWMSKFPNVDIRHGQNLTPSRWSQDQFRNQKYCQGWTEADAVPGWGRTKGRFWEFLAEALR